MLSKFYSASVEIYNTYLPHETGRFFYGMYEKNGLKEINFVEQYVLHSLEFVMCFLSFKAPLSERNYSVFNIGGGRVFTEVNYPCFVNINSRDWW